MPATFRSIVDPLAGNGLLYFYRDGDRDDEPSATFEFTGGEPWHLSGRRPFSWDYLEPSGERDYGVILLVLARSIRLRQIRRDLLPFPVRGKETVFVQVYRVQDDALIPQPGETFSFQQIAGQPFRWDRWRDPFGDRWWDPFTGLPSDVPPYVTSDHAIISPFPNGLRFAHEGGAWTFQISAPIEEPAAFAFDISVPQPVQSYLIFVVRTDNVRLTGGRVSPVDFMTPDVLPGTPRRPPVVVFESVVSANRLHEVPRLGASIDRDRFLFREWDGFQQWLSPEVKRRVAVIETLIGFVPYVGALYDISQLAYAAATGRNFWGETMDEVDYLVLGVVALLPVALSARHAKSVAQSLASRNRLFRAAVDEGTQSRVLQRVDDDLLEALRQLPLKEQERLLEAIDGLAKGTGSARQVLKQFDAAVRRRFLDIVERREVARTFERYADRLVEDPTFKEAARGLAGREVEFYEVYRAYRAGAVDVGRVLDFFDQSMAGAVSRFAGEQRLLTVFTDDFKHFRLEPLRTRYTQYLKEGKTLSAIQWAKSQSTGRYRQALEGALGQEYTQLINRTLGERFVYDVSPQARQAFEAILDIPGAQTYAELRELAARAGIGKLFEVDHIFEKRFLKSIRVKGEVPDEADFFSLLVPKNPAVARQIPAFQGIYTHSVKTQMLRELIPHGAEDLFTVQQWWDAHVFVLKQLGATPEVYMKKFAETFADVASTAREPFLARFDVRASMFIDWKPRRRLPGTVSAIPAPAAAP